MPYPNEMSVSMLPEKIHPQPEEIGSHNAYIAVGCLHAMTELLRQNDQGQSVALAIHVKAATAVHREARVAGGDETQSATGQDHAAPEVEIFAPRIAMMSGAKFSTMISVGL